MAKFIEIDLSEFVINDNIADDFPLECTCVCCLSQNTRFINLKTCKHKTFLEVFFKDMFPVTDLLICTICHRMLKLIHGFITKVEKSTLALNNKVSSGNEGVTFRDCDVNYKPKLSITKCQTLADIKVEDDIDRSVVDIKRRAKDCNYEASTVSIFNVEPNATCTEARIPATASMTQPNILNLDTAIKSSSFDDYDLITEIKIEPDSEVDPGPSDVKPRRNTSGVKKKKTKNHKKSKVKTPIEKHEGKIRTVTLSEEDLSTERELLRSEEKYQKLPYKCDLCVVGFATETIYQGHIQKHHNKNKNGFSCDICDSVLNSIPILREHRRRHLRRFECQICLKRYHDSYSAVQHYNDCHGDVDSIAVAYNCRECNFNTNSYRSYRYHRSKHNKPTCDLCGNIFVTNSSLKIHMLFECADCEGKFANKQSLRSHIEWEHLLMRHHRCVKCDKVFRSSASLKKHDSYVHEKKRPPRDKICDYCGEAFTIKLPNASVCCLCHSLLRKFQNFKNQTLRSFKILTEQVPVRNGTLRLQKTSIQTINIENTESKICKAENEDEIITENNVSQEFSTNPLKDDLFDEDGDFDRNYIDGENFKERAIKIVEMKIEDGCDVYRENNTESKNKANSDSVVLDNEAVDAVGVRTPNELDKMLPNATREVDNLLTEKIKIMVLTKEAVDRERDEKRSSETYMNLLYKCDDCVIGWNNENVYKKHFERHNRSNGHYLCQICTQVFKAHSEYLYHQKNHHTRYICVVCGKRYRGLESCVVHYNTEHGSDRTSIPTKEYCCANTECYFTTSKKSAYTKHVASHKPKPECGICYKQFANNHTLTLHIRKVHDKKNRTFKCQLCGNEYKSRGGLKHHTSSTHDVIKYYCPQCGKEFNSKYTLRNHAKHLHQDTEKRFTCHDCGDRFMLKSYLRTHIEMQHLHIEHGCRECLKIFRTETLLKKHVKRSHGNVSVVRERILCHQCGKEYRTEFQNTLVCNYCHEILRKIELFKSQVEESMQILNKQIFHTNENKIKKFNNLTSSNVTSIEINFLSEDTNIKPGKNFVLIVEDTNNEFLEEKHHISGREAMVDFENGKSSPNDTDVKVESDSSDLETALPLSQIKEKKRKNAVRGMCAIKKTKTEMTSDASPYMDESYVGKLTMLTLTREELELERDRMRTEENYLRLPYKCEDCIVGYNKDVFLKRHLRERHIKRENADVIVCEICKSTFNDKRSYVPHHRRHFIRYECNTCGKRYIDERAVVSHYNEKHGAEGATVRNKFRCNIRGCAYETHSYRGFVYHRSKHETYPCEKCGKVYGKWVQLRSHMYGVHNKKVTSYACPLCPKQYRQRCGLRAHTRATHGGALYRCTLCLKQFSTDNNLRRHLAGHSRHAALQPNRYTCDNCGAKFPTKSRLKGHIEWVHLKISNHRCNICLKMVRTARSLKNHIAYVHEKQKVPRDHICDYCGKAFTRRSLKSHMDTHTGARPHRCTHCGAAFTHSATLYNHKRLLHNAGSRQNSAP
ncbi:uncharacterized protein LOC101741752 isoform X4 [Bombyx mori]|uniref:C2H2-type domain-containing protein n=1 Tax=Bombyx mori TaxID=7091 RepID=A0A8R2HR15_BOMMO|nr:uncharacterized protein LOC101741752 isoform X4 [Bombyx mori]